MPNRVRKGADDDPAISLNCDSFGEPVYFTLCAMRAAQELIPQPLSDLLDMFENGGDIHVDC